MGSVSARACKANANYVAPNISCTSLLVIAS